MLNENYGFARGNNLAISMLDYKQEDYILCLNNDTIVDADCLLHLVNYADSHKEVVALTPAIRLFAQPDIMWNAGGRLTFGGRRYYYAYRPVSELRKDEPFDITFVTGCALFVRPSVLRDGRLFTEQFFFGEEDYNFSMRMLQEKQTMRCVPSATIYHKVSVSTRQATNYGRLFVFTLNRMIDLRQFYGPAKYALWRFLYMRYTRMRFLRRLSPAEQRHFIRLLEKEVDENTGVSREMFQQYMNYQIG